MVPPPAPITCSPITALKSAKYPPPILSVYEFPLIVSISIPAELIALAKVALPMLYIRANVEDGLAGDTFEGDSTSNIDVPALLDTLLEEPSDPTTSPP
jgi:hypothetical protein